MLLNNPNTNSDLHQGPRGLFCKGSETACLGLSVVLNATAVRRAARHNTEASKAVCSTGTQHAAGPQLTVKVLL